MPDTRLAKTYHPAHVPAAVEPTPEISPDQWRQVVARAKLELMLAKLAAVDSGNGRTDADASNSESIAPQSVAPLEEAFAALQSAIDTLATSKQSSNEPVEGKSDAVDNMKTVDAVWSAVGRFGAAVRDFDRGLSGQIETTVDANSDLSVRATRPTRLQAIRQSVRALRLIDARDVKQLGEIDPIGALDNADLFDLLAWQQQRLEAAAADAPAGDADYLADAARSYRLQAEQIPHQPPLQVFGVVPLQITGPSTISLTTEPEQQIDIVGAHGRRACSGLADGRLRSRHDRDSASDETGDLSTAGTAIGARGIRAGRRRTIAAASGSAEARIQRRALHAGESEPLRFKIRAGPGYGGNRRG